MHWLTMLSILIILGMIYGMGHLLWKLWQRQDATDQRQAATDRKHDQTREVAEAAASDAAACAAVIDRIEAPRPRPRLRAVRDERRGVSTWDWE